MKSLKISLILIFWPEINVIRNWVSLFNPERFSVFWCLNFDVFGIFHETKNKIPFDGCLWFLLCWILSIVESSKNLRHVPTKPKALLMLIGETKMLKRKWIVTDYFKISYASPLIIGPHNRMRRFPLPKKKMEIGFRIRFTLGISALKRWVWMNEMIF